MSEAVMENKNIKTVEAGKKSSVNFVGAISGLAGGFILILSGFVLSIISFFTPMNFGGWQVILFITAFIFLAIGAHFLDLIDREDKAERKRKLNL